MTFKTAWVGGSYEAACGNQTKKRPRTNASPLRNMLLEGIAAFPGTSTPLLKPDGYSLKSAHSCLRKMEKEGVVHAVMKYARAGEARGTTRTNHWYPGPAPDAEEES